MGLFSFFIKSPEKSEAKGDAYLEANNFGLAKIEYETAAELIRKKQPDDTDMKGRVLEKLTNSKESLALQHLKNGEELVEANALDEAANLFSIALSLTEDPELQQKLKAGYASMDVDIPEEEPEDDFEPADEPESYDIEAEFEILCSILPDEIAQTYRSYGDSFKEGYFALSNGDFVRAAEMLQQAMDENSSDDSHIPVELATALINTGQTEEAIGILTQYIKDQPEAFHGITLLCDLYCEQKQYDLAHGLIDQSPENIKGSVEGQLHKGRIHFYENDYQRAEKIYRNVLDAIGWNPDIARQLAMTLDAAGKKEDALSLYADLLNKCTGCGQRQNPLDKKAFADLSFEMNDFSAKTLNIYLDLANDHESIRSDCFHKASMIYSNTGNKKDAERFLQLAEATE